MKQPLAGRTVVVTRAASQADVFIAALESYGANVISCPTIEIAEPESYERLDEAIDHLYGYDWLIFTSANGVEYFLRRLNTRGLKPEELDELKVCAIGEATAGKLRDAHVHVDLIPSQSKAEGVFAALSEFAGGSERLHGLNFLIPRAAVGRDYIPKSLEAAGARVDVVTAYRTVLPENLDRGRLSAMLTGSADCIAFMSPSSVKNLALLFDTHDLGEKLHGLAIACIGDVTTTTAIEYGLRVHIQPRQTTAEDLANAIAKYFQDTNDAVGLN
jgi:uroporphyrinogen III methyltransferase / synthase